MYLYIFRHNEKGLQTKNSDFGNLKLSVRMICQIACSEFKEPLHSST